MARYIFVIGGVLSSLGKGITSASLAAVLQGCGYKVRVRKMDPYLNVDPGTLSPHQHGEVFVTEDGAETDMDLGHYERFTGIQARRSDSVTAGHIYARVIEKERRGDYLGATVQIIPHVTDLIKEFISFEAECLDFLVVEVGGTVGDIEGLPFIEAIRQFGNDVGRKNVLYAHLALLPYLEAAGELKTKPAQHSVKELLSKGIQPDFLIGRSTQPLPEEDRKKLSLFCNIPQDFIFSAPDVKSIYEMPLHLHKQDLGQKILSYFRLEPKTPDLQPWENLVQALALKRTPVKIGIVAKYLSIKDAYKSLVEALQHASLPHKANPEILWIDAEQPGEKIREILKSVSGIIVPGGFGGRGIEGKIAAVRYAREMKVPFLGICLGMQVALIEIARHVAHLPNAHSAEFEAEALPLIHHMKEWEAKEGMPQGQGNAKDLGGTLRLGTYPCYLKASSRAAEIYGAPLIYERHRHRYEVNLAYKAVLEKAGVTFSGLSKNEKLAEIIELADHPWFISVQFHPELKSSPFSPHPLFSSFIKASLNLENKDAPCEG